MFLKNEVIVDTHAKKKRTLEGGREERVRRDHRAGLSRAIAIRIGLAREIKAGVRCGKSDEAEGGAAFQAINQSNVGPDGASLSAATASQGEESEKSCPSLHEILKGTKGRKGH